jgi:mRNA capping enzyme, catalytic domain/mRNA capping enzyme, C-terminal domain
MADAAHRQALVCAGELWGDHMPRAYMTAIERGKPFLLCSHPVSMKRADMCKLKSHDYVVGDKTDGVRQFLLLGTIPGGATTYACVIDRNCTVTMLPAVRVSSPQLYRGTLIDGEFISQTATFVALDIVAVGGVQAWCAPHGKRMGALHSVLPSIQTDGWTIVPKPWYPLSAVRSIPGTEGLIFVPVQESMKPGKCDSLFKWKAVHTLDFIKAVDGQLYMTDRGTPVCVSHMFTVSSSSFDAASTAAAAVIECRLEPRAAAMPWVLYVIKVRTDKSTPNDITTLHATMRNVLEAVSRTELNSKIGAATLPAAAAM